MELKAASIDGSKSSATSALDPTLIKAFQVARDSYSPCQLQLTLTDTDTEVLIKRRTELNILGLLQVAKQTLSRFIKALGDMFQGVLGTIFGTAKLILRADEVP